MSETDAVFRVTLLNGRSAILSYPREVAERLQSNLDDAETILCCPECGDLAPVTEGIPPEMPRCPSCGEPLRGVEEVERIDWQERAARLERDGGVPSRRAQVVALVESGCSHSQVAEVLDLNNRSNVAAHVASYREQLEQAEWLAEHGPEV